MEVAVRYTAWTTTIAPTMPQVGVRTASMELTRTGRVESRWLDAKYAGLGALRHAYGLSEHQPQHVVVDVGVELDLVHRSLLITELATEQLDLDPPDRVDRVLGRRGHYCLMPCS